MTDINPTVPNNFMQAAAEKAISDLQHQVDDAQASAQAAQAAADSVARSATLWKRFTLGLLIGFVLLLGMIGAGARMYLDQQSAIHEIRQNAVTACQHDNYHAAGTVTALDELVRLLEGPSPTAKVQQEAAAYEKFVVQHNQQRDCSRP